MTEDKVASLKLLWNEYNAEMARHKDATASHEARIKHLVGEMAKITKKCDHKHPNGQSSWVGGFGYSECKICGMTDL